MEGYLTCMAEMPANRSVFVASLVLASMAAGRFDCFWEMHLKPWDIAADVLLMKEAGGLVSDFQSGENYLESSHIICAIPKLFKPTLQAVKKILAI